MWPFKSKEEHPRHPGLLTTKNAKAVAEANRKVIAQAEAELASLRKSVESRRHKPIPGISMHRRKDD